MKLKIKSVDLTLNSIKPAKSPQELGECKIHLITCLCIENSFAIFFQLFDCFV